MGEGQGRVLRGTPLPPTWGRDREGGSTTKDLTQGSVTRHILTLSAFIALSTTFQTLYFLADLYFVGRLGKEAIAAVGLGGNQMMLVLALTQTLGVGTTSLIAQALGRKDRDRAERIFNQSLVLSVLVGLAFGVAAFAGGLVCRRSG